MSVSSLAGVAQCSNKEVEQYDEETQQMLRILHQWLELSKSVLRKRTNGNNKISVGLMNVRDHSWFHVKFCGSNSQLQQ